jgi:hypothetical protein
LDDRDLEREPRVVDADGKRPAVVQETVGAVRERMDANQQGRRRPVGAEHLHRCARRRQGIERNIDAIEIAIVLGAIL